MLIKVLAAIMFIITMSHMNGMVPGDVFKKNVDNNRNRTMLTIIDDAIINYFCNSGGKLPDKLTDLVALKDKEDLKNNFDYNVKGGKYTLKIKGTNETSANSGRVLNSDVFNYTADENGNQVFVGEDSIMHALITYDVDWTGRVIGIQSIACDVWYGGDRANSSNAYVADFSQEHSWSVAQVISTFEKLFNGASAIYTYDQACGQDGEIVGWLLDEIKDDIKDSWLDPDAWARTLNQ